MFGSATFGGSLFGGTPSASASSGAGANARVNAQLDDVSISSGGLVTVSGSVNATLDGATLSAAGTVTVSGSGNATLDAASLACSGAVTVSGQSAIILDDSVVASTASSGGTINATVNVLLEDHSLISAGLSGIGKAARAAHYYFEFRNAGKSFIFTQGKIDFQ